MKSLCLISLIFYSIVIAGALIGQQHIYSTNTNDTCMKMRKAYLNNIQWLTSHIRRPLEMMSVACDLHQNTSESHSDISMFLKYLKSWTLDIKKTFFSSPLHLQYVYCVCVYLLSHVWLCEPMGCTLPGSSGHGDSLGKNTGMGCHVLLQGIFPTQGLNPGRPYYWWILYRLSH